MSSIPQALIDRLNHPHHNERSAAVLELGRLDSPNRLPLLIEALRTEPDLNVREDITYTIVRIGNGAARPLIGLLRDENARVRHDAAHVLGKLASPDAVDALIDALQDADTAVVSKAALALGQIGDAKAVTALIPLLGHDTLDIQSMAVNVLEQFGVLAVPALVQAVEHEDWQVREHAAAILGMIGDQAGIPALIGALQDAYWQVRFAAVQALGEVGGSEAKNALRQAQGDLDARVSKLAQRLLG